MLSNIDWGKASQKVEIAGVNAYAFIPFLIYIFNLASLKFFLFFLFSVIFLVITEKYFKLELFYVLDALRCLVTGSKKSPKLKKFDY